MATKKSPEELPLVVRKPVPEDGLGERLKLAREARDWTQSVLSARTKMADPNCEGVSRTVLVGYETGKYKPGARELRLIAEALNVTPNWLLYGTEKPFRATLPSMAFLQGDDNLEKALRISLALLTLKPHERELIGSLMLSLAGRQLGDVKLSALMSFAKMFTGEAVQGLREKFGTDSIEDIVRGLSDGAANWGTNLKFNDDGEIISGTPIYPEPPSSA